MTRSKLEMPTNTTERLAEIFESYIPFNKFLGLRCLEIEHGSVRVEPLIAVARVVRLGNRVGVAELRAFHPDSEDRPVAAGMGVYSVKRDNSGEGGTWEWKAN